MFVYRGCHPPGYIFGVFMRWGFGFWVWWAKAGCSSGKTLPPHGISVEGDQFPVRNLQCYTILENSKKCIQFSPVLYFIPLYYCTVNKAPFQHLTVWLCTYVQDVVYSTYNKYKIFLSVKQEQQLDVNYEVLRSIEH